MRRRRIRDQIKSDFKRSFHCFTVRSSSALEDKIIIFERFHCSLTKIIQLNYQLITLIGKIEICSIWVNFSVKIIPGPPPKISKNRPFQWYFAQYLLSKLDDPHFFHLFHWQVNDLKYLKKLQKSFDRNLKYNWLKTFLLTPKHHLLILCA